ncbi:MAG: phage head-tail connector protein [Rhodomicrobium sp.]|nr:MAG: phage head-tail connector protein [Rhodomicrobium sp.]
MQCKALKKRYDALKTSTERVNWESHCEELARVIMPKRQGFVGTMTPGTKRQERLLSSFGIWVNETLAGGLHGFATNPSAKWFSLGMADNRQSEDPAVKKYLSDVEEIMWARMYAPGSNLITALHESYLDIGCFGTAGLYIDWDEKGEHLTFESRELCNLVLAESNRGLIDTVFRRFSWTIRQAAQEWGKENLSEECQKKMAANKWDDKITIIHAIFPRDEYNNKYGEGAPQNQPIASLYFELDAEHKLEEGGYPEMPYAIARWSRITGEVYGRGPGMTALADLNMLQAKELTIIKAGQKAVDPSYLIRHDGFIDPMRLIPGGITKVRGNPRDAVLPMPFQGNLAYGREDIQALESRIMNTFHVDQLQFINDVKMTATEVMQRTQERMRLLGPMLGRLESELLGPLVARVYGLLDRLELLPEPPEQIIGSDFTVQYVSPIAQAQRAVEIDTWRQFVAACEVYLQTPETAAGFFEQYPVENVAAHFAKLLNLDPDLSASNEQREASAQQQQMMQMAQMAQPALQGAQAVNQLSQAGANIPADIEGAQALQDNIDPEQAQAMLEQVGGIPQ